jgi:hypothetical protein
VPCCIDELASKGRNYDKNIKEIRNEKHRKKMTCHKERKKREKYKFERSSS